MAIATDYKLSKLAAELATFFIKHYFHLKVDKLQLFWRGYLTETSSKIKSECGTSRKTMVFVANDTIWVLKQKLEFWKICVITMSLKFLNI